MKIERINPHTVHPPGPYSHLITASGGKLLTLSGQVAFDKDRNLIGAGDLYAQTKQVLANIQAVLASVGADFSNVLKLTMYVANYTPEKRNEVIRALQECLDMSNPPANILLGVQSLALDELLIEIDTLAMVEA